MLFSMFIYNVSQILQIEKISSTPERYMNKMIRLLMVELVETKQVGRVETLIVLKHNLFLEQKCSEEKQKGREQEQTC